MKRLLPVLLTVLWTVFALRSLRADDAPVPPLLPLPTPAAAALRAAPDAAHFRFVVGGDNRSTGHGQPMPLSLGVICREIGQIGPDFVLWSGDTIEGYDDTIAEANAEYDTFLACAAAAYVPFFNAPGNHELAKNPALVGVYRQRMGRLYGSFDYGNSHFIALNTCPLSADGKQIEEGIIDEAQMRWLEQDLQSSGSATHRFVFLHHYVFGPPDDDPNLDSGFKSLKLRDRLHALFVKYRVRAVFAGHNHRYWHGVRDGIDYFISGGGGAPLDAAPDDGGFLHYLLITVDDDKISTQIAQPWHLTIGAPVTADKTVRVDLTNTNNFPVRLRNVRVVLPEKTFSANITVEGRIFYKGKTTPVEVQIVRVEPLLKTGTALVTVALTLPPHRTTQLSVIRP